MTIFFKHRRGRFCRFGSRTEQVAVRGLRHLTVTMEWGSGSDGRLHCRWRRTPEPSH